MKTLALLKTFSHTGFYDEVSGEALIHSLHQVYNKLKLFRATGYSSAPVRKTSASSGLNIYTHNYVTVNVNFAQIRQEVKNMPSVLPEEQEEILDKIDKLEKIVHSKDSKEKKWDQTKAIIKWMADKGVDVGIAILPLLLQIK